MNLNPNLSSTTLSNSSNKAGSSKKSGSEDNEKKSFQKLLSEKSNEAEIKDMMSSRPVVNKKHHESDSMAVMVNDKSIKKNNLKLFKQEEKNDFKKPEKEDEQVNSGDVLFNEQSTLGQLSDKFNTGMKMFEHFSGKGANHQLQDFDSLDNTELLLLSDSQSPVNSRPSPQSLPGAPMTSVFEKSFVDFIERHVQRFLANDSAAKGENGGQVIMKLSNALLPGTDLVLTRIAGGWNLKASTTDHKISDLLRRSTANLSERFAKKDFGFIEVETNSGNYINT